MNLDTQLTQLETAQLVRRLVEEDATYMFKHALTQDAAYESLLLKQRREIHRRIAQTIEVLYANRLDEFAAQLAQHYAQAGDDAKTLDYSIRAGDVAARAYAYREARASYTLALDALTRLPDTVEHRRHRIDTLTKHVGASLTAASPETNAAQLAQAETLLRALPAASTPAEMSPADQQRLARVHYWLGLVSYYANQPQDAIQHFQQVLAIARGPNGDPDLLPIPSVVIGRVNVIQGYFNRAEALLAPAIERLERSANWDIWTMALCFLGQALAGRGNYQAGVAAVERALARAKQVNDQHSLALCHASLSIVHLIGGDIPQMLQEGRACVEVAEPLGDRTFVYCGLGFQSWAQSRMGLIAAAIVTMDQVNDLLVALGGHLVLTDLFSAASAEIALKAGQIAEAINLAEKTATSSQVVNNIFAQGLAHRVWGQALAARNEWNESHDHFVESLRLLEEGDARLEAARTHFAWGNALRSSGKIDQARAQFDQAAAQFETSGLARELAEARKMVSEANNVR